jgi:hypothetical protein
MKRNKQKFFLTIEMLHHGLSVTGAKFEHVPLNMVGWLLKEVR